MKLEEKIKRFKEGGLDKMHVVADFDRTLTYAKIGDREVPSVISLLRDGNYISPEYAAKAKELFAKYHPMEVDEGLSQDERRKAMNSWWTEHFELLIKSGLNKKHLERIVESAGIKFREGVLEFLDYLNDREIPLVILSSSGVGETIPMLLEKEGRMYDNIVVVTNRFEWGSDGRAIGIRRPIIHGMNKDETEIPKEVHERIMGRRNVLLLGDSPDDLGMVAGIKYDCLISFGFLNPGKGDKKQYEEQFDFVIENDGNFDEINKFVKEIEG